VLRFRRSRRTTSDGGFQFGRCFARLLHADIWSRQNGIG
jgi:hypothetical protein